MVTVVMTTYNPEPDAPRNRYAQRCVRALEDNLRGADEYELIASDDGSPEPFAPRWNGGFWSSCSVVTGPHNGIGASLNRALDGIVGPWVYTTDDWLLTEALDLTLPLWLLAEGGYDMVRVGPIHPNLTCKTQFTAGRGWWLELFPAFGGYCFATRPFLAAPRLVEKMGLFAEGLNAYETERLYAERCQKFFGSLRFAAVNLAGPWEHIGEYEVGDRPVEAFSVEKGGLR